MSYLKLTIILSKASLCLKLHIFCSMETYVLNRNLFSVTNAFISERSLCCAVVKVSLEVSAASRGMWLHIRGCNVLLIGRYVCGAGSLL